MWGVDRRLEAVFVTRYLNWDNERKRSNSVGADRPLLGVVNGLVSDGDSNGGNGGGSNGGAWRDVWLDRCPEEDGYTYDSKDNPMLRGNLRRRFDRCLYWTNNGKNSSDVGDRGQPSFLAPHSIKMIGTDAIEGLQWKKEVQKWVGGRPTSGTGYNINEYS